MESTKMIVFRQNRVFLKYIGLLLTDNQNSNSDNLIFHIFYTMPMVAIVAFSIGYFIKNMSDMSKATEAAYPIIGISLYFVEYWAFALQKNEFRKLLANLEDIVGMRKHTPAFKSYEAIEEKANDFTKKFTYRLCAIVSVCFVLPYIVAAFTFIMGTYTHEVWYLPYKNVTPYDQRSLIGYTVTLFIQTLAAFNVMIVMCSINSLYFGTCWYIETMIDDVNAMLSDTDALIGNEKEIKASLKKTVLFHNTIIRFLDKFAEFLTGIIFITFGFGVMWICTALFQMQMTAETFDFMFLQILATLSVIVSNLFIYCNFGDVVTHKFATVADSAYAGLWYEYPIKLQKYYILILVRSQRPFYFTGYGISRCSLDNFKTLMNAAFSFFMVLRAVE